jgi:hypothetical protein
MNKHNKIIFCAPPRSGSTLLYNIINIILDIKLKKYHTFPKNISKDNIYITCVRHPYDAINSGIHVLNIKNNNSEIIKYIKYWESCIQNMLQINVNNKNILIFDYNKFDNNNFEYIFTELSNFLKINISENKKQYIINNFNINTVKEITKNIGKFDKYNKKTLFHGNHIINYNKDIKILDEKIILYLEKSNTLKKYINLFL